MGAKIKPHLAPLVYRLAALIGRYADGTPAQRRHKRFEPIAFRGEIPPGAGREKNQYRMGFVEDRPAVTKARHVIYTPQGMAWVDNKLQRRYSFQEVNIGHLRDKPKSPKSKIASGSVLYSQTPKTFGDWMSEHVVSISRAIELGVLVEPLLVPQAWYAKAYVQRDIARLGIKAMPVTDVLHIDEVTVLNKTRPSHYWTRSEADAVLKAMGISRLPAKTGTAIYLSRLGERGEGPQRVINNVVIEAAMDMAGVRVLRTAGRTQEDYIAAAEDAETVFADHGSAIYNVLHWKTKRVVEFFTPKYWDNSFLILSQCIDIKDYNIWRIDQNTTARGLADRISELMRSPIAQS